MDRRPLLPPSEDNFYLSGEHRMVSPSLALHVETWSFIFFAEAEKSPMVLDTTEGYGLITALERVGSSQSMAA